MRTAWSQLSQTLKRSLLEKREEIPSFIKKKKKSTPAAWGHVTSQSQQAMCCLLSHTFSISSDNWCEGPSSKSEAFTLCDRVPFTTLVRRGKKGTCCVKQLLFERLCKCLTNYNPRKHEVQSKVFTFLRGKKNGALWKHHAISPWPFNTHRLQRG